MASAAQNARIKELRRTDPVFAAKLRLQESVKTKRISEQRRIAREARGPRTRQAEACARSRAKLLSDPIRAEAFRQRAKEKARKYREAAQWASSQRRSAQWVFLANQVPGCVAPLWCCDCRAWFAPADHAISSGRCKKCSRAYGVRSGLTPSGRIRRRKNNRARVHRLRAGGEFPQKQWEALLFRCGGKCVRCLSTKDISIDHILPVSKGGTNDISNLQPLCRVCNLKKRTDTVDYRPIRHAR